MSNNGENTLRVTACGTTLSGKGTLIWNRWVSKRPRVIIVDHTGEWQRRKVSATYANRLGGVVDAIEANAHRERFRVVCNLKREEIAELAMILVPPDDIWGKSPLVPMGGASIYLPEVDQSIDPNPYDESRSLWRRGRHGLLDVFADSQAASSTSKEVFRNSEIVAIMSLHFKRDLEYVEELSLTPERYAKVRDWIRKPYHACLFMPHAGFVSFVTPCNRELAT